MLASALVLLAPPTQIAAWVVAWNMESVARLESSGHQLSEALIECIKVKPDGSVELRDTFQPVKARIKAAAKKHRFTMYAMASNFDGDFDSKRMALVFGSPTVTEKHIAGLIAIAKSEGFQGIDIDYESMKAASRQGFSDFAQTLSTRLHQAKLKLSITVHPKESEPGTWDGPRAQDWKVLGAAADSFRLMCYDNHWSTSDPGSIAPDAWVESVVKFAKTQVPKNKLSIGVAGYGYDWTEKPATSLTWTDWSKKYKEPSGIDSASGELTQPKAYFGGTTSILRKLAIARRHSIPSVSLWYLGSEEPSLWTSLSGNR